MNPASNFIAIYGFSWGALMCTRWLNCGCFESTPFAVLDEQPCLTVHLWGFQFAVELAPSPVESRQKSFESSRTKVSLKSSRWTFNGKMRRKKSRFSSEVFLLKMRKKSWGRGKWKVYWIHEFDWYWNTSKEFELSLKWFNLKKLEDCFGIRWGKKKIHENRRKA